MYLTDLLENQPALSMISPDSGHDASGHEALVITGLSDDSRRVSAGHVFFAIKGGNHDGRDYAAAARAAGAIAIITDDRPLDGDIKNLATEMAIITCANPQLALAKAARQFWPKQPGLIAAITGTNGKTSTAEFLRQIWSRVTWDAASIGTLGLNGADTRKLAGKMLELPNLTTPDAISLHSTLNLLGGVGLTHLALEASSHGLAQNRLDGLNIHVAAFTNLTRDHLDHHHEMDSYFVAKSRLFTDILMHAGAAIINIDDDYGRRLVDLLKADKSGGKSGGVCEFVISTFGWADDADFKIDALDSIGNGQLIKVTHKGQQYQIPVALSADFQAVNALTAAIMAYHSGLALHDSLGAMAYLTPAPGRMQTVTGHPTGARVVVDYAHTPDALGAALASLRAEAGGKLAVLFGCGGERDKGKRQMMGEIAAKMADVIYITDDNPRSEDAATIRAEIIAGCPDATEIAQRDNAIKAAIDALGGDDVLLIAGKGHEMVQLVGSETLPFSDASVAQNVIADLAARSAPNAIIGGEAKDG